jgi:hypothetical protein
VLCLGVPGAVGREPAKAARAEALVKAGQVVGAELVDDQHDHQPRRGGDGGGVDGGGAGGRGEEPDRAESQEIARDFGGHGVAQRWPGAYTSRFMSL